MKRTDEHESKTYLSAAELGLVGVWRYKSTSSVGKEVARHLRAIKNTPMGSVVEYVQRTKAWRLSLKASRLEFIPGREAVEQWLESRTFREPEPDAVSSLLTLIDTSLAYEQGQFEQVSSALACMSRQSDGPVRNTLDACAAVLRGRAAMRLEDSDCLEALVDEWSDRDDPIGRAAFIHLKALLAIQDRFGDPDVALRSLERLAADTERRGGDTSALSILLNAMGILARRLGRYQLAIDYHTRATAGFALCGDHYKLQATVFNIAICRADMLEQADRPPDEAVLALVDACRRICAQFGIGNDSAQAEINGAIWALRRGELDRARMYLDAAETLVANSDSSFENACFLIARAQLQQVTGEPNGSHPARDLRVAQKLFAEIGDHRMEHLATTMARWLTRSKEWRARNLSPATNETAGEQRKRAISGG
jgi:tetratricopeptide (TPR) repeat protein